MSSDAERRERYAAVMMQKWRDADWDVSEYDLADAAMAVADAEHGAFVHDLARAEMDIATWQGRYLSSVVTYQDMHGELESRARKIAQLVEEADRLSEERNEAREQLADMTADRDRWQDTFFEQG